MGAGASAAGGGDAAELTDKTAGDVAAFVADQGKDFQGYSEALVDQGIDGKTLANMDTKELEEAMDAAKIDDEEHREILRECCANCGAQCGSAPGRKRTARAPCCSGGEGGAVVLTPAS